MRILKFGDPCPFCGRPLPVTDLDHLRFIAEMADIIGLPEYGTAYTNDSVSIPESQQQAGQGWESYLAKESKKEGMA